MICKILIMEAPFFVKCEPGWPSGREESSNIEQVPSVKHEDMKVEPCAEEETSTFVKEEHLAEDVKNESDHENYDIPGQLPSQIPPLLHRTIDDSVITTYECRTKQDFSVGYNSNATYSEGDGSNVVENEQDKWICEYCRESFITESLLQKHVLLHGKNGQISPPWNTASDTISNSENYYSCDGCGKLLVRCCLHEFKDTNFLLCLQCLSRATSRRKEVHLCRHCGKNFPYRSSLTRHIRTHTGLKPYSCTRCGSAFSELTNLKRHEISHTGEKGYICNCCKKKFTCKSSLKTHMYTHKSERPYKCTSCNKSFSSSWFLKRHATTHSEEKPFVCYSCGKSFVQKSDLVRHSVTHTGEKPFSCTYCQRAFAQKCTLKSHMRTHTGDRPYPCSICSKSFCVRSALMNHMVIHAVQ